ncbi:hypothetical protein [Glutamicibacter arilaitensis]
MNENENEADPESTAETLARLERKIDELAHTLGGVVAMLNMMDD